MWFKYLMYARSCATFQGKWHSREMKSKLLRGWGIRRWHRGRRMEPRAQRREQIMKNKQFATKGVRKQTRWGR